MLIASAFDDIRQLRSGVISYLQAMANAGRKAGRRRG